MHRTSERQTDRQPDRRTPASCHRLTGDSSLHMGMGVAGKREDMVSSKASAGHPLMCVRELAGRRARRSWKVQCWEWGLALGV